MIPIIQKSRESFDVNNFATEIEDSWSTSDDYDEGLGLASCDKSDEDWFLYFSIHYDILFRTRHSWSRQRKEPSFMWFDAHV